MGLAMAGRCGAGVGRVASRCRQGGNAKCVTSRLDPIQTPFTIDPIHHSSDNLLQRWASSIRERGDCLLSYQPVLHQRDPDHKLSSRLQAAGYQELFVDYGMRVLCPAKASAHGDSPGQSSE